VSRGKLNLTQLYSAKTKSDGAEVYRKALLAFAGIIPVVANET